MCLCRAYQVESETTAMGWEEGLVVDVVVWLVKKKLFCFPKRNKKVFYFPLSLTFDL